MDVSSHTIVNTNLDIPGLLEPSRGALSKCPWAEQQVSGESADAAQCKPLTLTPKRQLEIRSRGEVDLEGFLSSRVCLTDHLPQVEPHRPTKSSSILPPPNNGYAGSPPAPSDTPKSPPLLPGVRISLRHPTTVSIIAVSNRRSKSPAAPNFISPRETQCCLSQSADGSRKGKE